MSVKAALDLAEGLVTVAPADGEEKLFSERQACTDCGVSVPALEPRSFSFNSKYGACPKCDGMGIEMAINPENLILDPDLPVAQMKFPLDNARIERYLHESLLAVARQFQVRRRHAF